jgi:hypothetical protein
MSQNKVPIAEVVSADSEVGDAPPVSIPPVLQPTIPGFPPFKFCPTDLKQGCYKITFRPTGLTVLTPYYVGTLRVENVSGGKTISADLYKFRSIIFDPPIVVGPLIPIPIPHPDPGPLGPIGPVLGPVHDNTGDGENIPIYARNKYYSYLKGTGYSRPQITTTVCTITVTAQEFVYTQPASGFSGSFSSSPTRTVRIVVSPTSDPNVFTGSLFEGTSNKGTIRLEWVSNFFRRAVVEIDTLTGAVAPQPLNPGTSSERSFPSGFKTAGWRMDAIYNNTNVAVPPGVTATNCWTDASLHSLMMAVRSPAANLDAEWRFHMMVVPGKMGCSRGKMYDQTGAHREGVVSYSNDGYPTTDSLNFGTAANQMQRNVPLAFLRSASHELGHACNMQHQELEGGADNSLMTTTPSVADVLGSATTGAPGVFPTNINIGFNAHCRHHLIHFPDPVVRPGGMNWTAGHPGLGGVFAPSADTDRILLTDSGALKVTIKTQSDRVKLGEPLLMAWEVENSGKEDIYMPNDIGLNIEYTQVSVTDPSGRIQDLPSFILECEHSSIQKLEPKKKLAAATNLFWSSKGFAFSRAGKHRIDLMIRWTYKGLTFGAHGSKDVWVDFPTSDKENEIAAEAFDNEVGMFVALGGGAYHLEGAAKKIEKIMKLDPKSAVAKSFAKFYSTSAAKAFKPMKLVREKQK